MNDFFEAFTPSVRQLHMIAKPPLIQGLEWELIFVAGMILAGILTRGTMRRIFRSHTVPMAAIVIAQTQSFVTFAVIGSAMRMMQSELMYGTTFREGIWVFVWGVSMAIAYSFTLTYHGRFVGRPKKKQPRRDERPAA